MKEPMRRYFVDLMHGKKYQFPEKEQQQKPSTATTVLFYYVQVNLDESARTCEID